MQAFDTLYKIADSIESLDAYLSENVQLLNDLNNCNYEVINDQKELIEKFILLKYNELEKLDFSKGYNKSFLTLLLDFSERFTFYSCVPRLYSILWVNEINIGYRLTSALQYLSDIDQNSRLIERFDSICEGFQWSIDYQEDDDSKSVASFLNYYSSVILNTPLEYGVELLSLINASISENRYGFLSNQFILNALEIPFSVEPQVAYTSIQYIIDELLCKKNIEIHTNPEESGLDAILIESNSSYSLNLMTGAKDFHSVRQISVDAFRNLENRNNVFKSLGRGVRILESEEQMFSYMNSFGNVHHAKLQSAFENFPFEDIVDRKIEIIDWGCGQGLATISLYDFLYKKNVQFDVSKVILIEPSKVCLMRASLHVKFFNESEIDTVLKKLDYLDTSDFNTNDECIKIHLLSNILDIDSFSIDSLTQLISSTFSEINYFVCVSPFITDIKTNRIESFCDFFENNFQSYTLISEITNGGRAEDDYWKCNNAYKNNMCSNHPYECNGSNKWTRVVRIFKVEL